MSYARNRSIALGLLLGALLALPARAQEIYAARVNGAGITVQEVEAGFDETLKERGLHLLQVRDPAKLKQMKHNVLERLIDDELLWQEARKNNALATDAEVDAAFAQAAQAFKSEEKFRLRLAQENFTEEDYKERIRRKLSGQAYANAAAAKGVEVSEDDIQAFYKANPDKFHRPEMLRARHILIKVAPDATKAQRADARRKIRDLLAEARAGRDFAELALENSDDATRQWGGELDPFPRGRMAPAFDKAAFALKPGQVSGVVTTPSGFHIIKLEERFPAVSISLKDAHDRIEGYLRSTRQQAALAKLLEELRAQAKIEMLLPL